MKKLLVGLILATLFIFKCQAQQITINEFMSKNETIILGPDDEYNDWIELYNSHQYSINLVNYKLSDDKDRLDKWRFPDINIPSQSSLLVFASGKDTINGAELHTNFKISSLGEALYLSNPSGDIIDSIRPVILEENESFGRLPDGTSNLVNLDTPSPGTSNNNTSQLVFSENAGYFEQGFKLNIKSLRNDTIYYTTDGSIPTVNSLVFSDSITIYNRTANPNYFSEFRSSPEQSLISYKAWKAPSKNLDKATTLRSVSIKNGQNTSRVYTQTYFIDENIFSKYKHPILSIVTEESNLFDSDSGIYVPGINFKLDNPEWSGNYFESGIEWEKPIHIEYFSEDGRVEFHQDAGIRIHGGKTRQAAQKSLRIYARKEYGKEYFKYRLFPEKETVEFKRFLLRTTMGSWNDQSIIKDVLAHNIAKDLNIETQDFQPVIVFINGEYWGIHSLRDRIDKHYIKYEFNIDKDSIDLIGGNFNLVFAGDNSHYISLIEFIENNDLSIQNNYEYVKTQIDIDNFISYQIAEMFFANKDWPSNNSKLWRTKTKDGKWRWIFYDLDAGLLDANKNMFVHCLNTDTSITWPNAPESTFLFRNLITNNNFLDKFINRYAEILNTTFATSSILDKVKPIKELYKNEIDSHIERWEYPESYSKWERDIEEKLVGFLADRLCAVEKNMNRFIFPDHFNFDCTENLGTSFLELYPNPNTGEFTFVNNSEQTIKGDLVISSILGVIVYQENYVYLNTNEEKKLNLKHLNQGIYALNFNGLGNSDTLFFVIIH